MRFVLWRCGGARGLRGFLELIFAIERYLEPESHVAGSDCSSDSTFSDDGAGPSAKIHLELAPESADAEPLEEAGASSASPHVRSARAVAEREERWKDMQALMDAMEARAKLNEALCFARNSLSAKSEFFSESTRSDKC
eukprot:71625-Pleurochrysis_carterae.AAC.2